MLRKPLRIRNMFDLRHAETFREQRNQQGGVRCRGLAHGEARVNILLDNCDADPLFGKNRAQHGSRKAPAQYGDIKSVLCVIHHLLASNLIQCWTSAAPHEKPAPFVTNITRSPSWIWPSSIAST